MSEDYLGDVGAPAARPFMDGAEVGEGSFFGGFNACYQVSIRMGNCEAWDQVGHLSGRLHGDLGGMVFKVFIEELLDVIEGILGDVECCFSLSGFFCLGGCVCDLSRRIGKKDLRTGGSALNISISISKLE